MARSRKKKSTHRRHRRRSVGALNMKKVGSRLIGVVGGAFLVRTLNNMAVKQFPTVDQKLIGIGDVAVSFLIPKFVKNEIGQGISDAFLAIGGLTTLQAFGAINGIGAVSRVPSRVIGRPNFNQTIGNRPIFNQRVGARPNFTQRIGSAENEMMRMNRQAMGAAMGSLFVEE